MCFFFFKQKTAYEMRISDWSSDVCSSDLGAVGVGAAPHTGPVRQAVAFVAQKRTPTYDALGRIGRYARVGRIEGLGRAMRVVYRQIGGTSCRERVCLLV